MIRSFSSRGACKFRYIILEGHQRRAESSFITITLALAATLRT
jgi:hypothetical protein